MIDFEVQKVKRKTDWLTKKIADAESEIFDLKSTIKGEYHAFSKVGILIICFKILVA